MDESILWKNFNLGTELQISGTFIYNGLLAFEEMESFYHEEVVFEFLYNISVGIERLLKINVILIEHNDLINQEIFFESIKNHNHQDLIARVAKKHRLKASKPKNSFIQLLNSFYNLMRYDRYTNKEPLNYDKERRALISFLEKYLKVQIRVGVFETTENSLLFKQFMGKIIRSIVDEQFSILQEEAFRLNIYVHEIRTYSKAYKIFMMDEFTFENENRIQRELLVKFLNGGLSPKFSEIIKQIKPLEFENYSDNFYIKCMFNKLETLQLDGELDLVIESPDNTEERLEMINEIGNQLIDFESDEF